MGQKNLITNFLHNYVFLIKKRKGFFKLILFGGFDIFLSQPVIPKVHETYTFSVLLVSISSRRFPVGRYR